MGSTAEVGKHDVDEVVDDVVLVSGGAQGHECAVGRLGVTVAKCFGEGVERRIVVRSAVARFGGSAGRRPGGGDVDDALPCGLSSLGDTERSSSARAISSSGACSVNEFAASLRGIDNRWHAARSSSASVIRSRCRAVHSPAMSSGSMWSSGLWVVGSMVRVSS